MGSWTHSWIFMWLWWGLIATAIFLVIWFVVRANRTRVDDDDAEAILRRRFAAGELDEHEFQERMAVLRRG